MKLSDERLFSTVSDFFSLSVSPFLKKIKRFSVQSFFKRDAMLLNLKDVQIYKCET